MWPVLEADNLSLVTGGSGFSGQMTVSDSGVTWLAQLRFERHPRVHKVFLNMWG